MMCHNPGPSQEMKGQKDHHSDRDLDAIIAQCRMDARATSDSRSTGHALAGARKHHPSRTVVPAPWHWRIPPVSCCYRCSHGGSKNLRLQTYGDGKKNILVAIGKNEIDPHFFDGLYDNLHGLTPTGQNNYFDLTGKRRSSGPSSCPVSIALRPLIKLTDGTLLLIGDQAPTSSIADWQAVRGLL